MQKRPIFEIETCYAIIWTCSAPGKRRLRLVSGLQLVDRRGYYYLKLGRGRTMYGGVACTGRKWTQISKHNYFQNPFSWHPIALLNVLQGLSLEMWRGVTPRYNKVYPHPLPLEPASTSSVPTWLVSDLQYCSEYIYSSLHGHHMDNINGNNKAFTRFSYITAPRTISLL